MPAKEASSSSYSDKRVKFKNNTIVHIVNNVNSSSSFVNAQNVSDGKGTPGLSTGQGKKCLNNKEKEV